jgi:hypothetical protein
MRVEPSVLFNSVRGKAGSIVASSWKGQGVVRKHAVPSNPNTEAQQRVRTEMAMIVVWYQTTSAAMKTFLNVLAAGLTASGWNLFARQNMRDLEALPTPIVPRIFPTSSVGIPLVSITPTTHSSTTKGIALVGVKGLSGNSDPVYVLAAPMTGDDYDGTIELITEEMTVADVTGATQFTVAQAAKKYMIFVGTCLGGVYSVAVSGSATSHA